MWIIQENYPKTRSLKWHSQVLIIGEYASYCHRNSLKIAGRGAGDVFRYLAIFLMTVILGSRSEAPEQLVNDAGLGALPGQV